MKLCRQNGVLFKGTCWDVCDERFKHKVRAPAYPQEVAPSEREQDDEVGQEALILLVVEILHDLV